MQKNVFNQFYEDYDSWYDTQAGAFVDQVETTCAFDLLQPASNDRVLDIGCGTGNFSLKLARMNCQVSGVDIAEKMLMQAQEKAQKEQLEIDFYHLDAKKLPFLDASFDKVISMAAFEFIEKPKIVFDEMMRVLRPGGTMVIGTIEKGGEWEKLYSSDACKQTAYEQATFLTADDLIALNDGQYTSISRCLFVPPMASEEIYTLENEKKGQLENKVGGFVCVSFTKA